jgi:hypothetical protein
VLAPGSLVAHNSVEFSVSAIALAVLLLAAAPQRARAANECGVDGAGPTTLTCAPGNYAAGVTYTNSNGLTLNLDNPGTVVTGQVSTQATFTAPTGAQLTINVTNGTITSTGSAVSVSNAALNGVTSINIQGGTLTSTGVANTVAVSAPQTSGNSQLTTGV